MKNRKIMSYFHSPRNYDRMYVESSDTKVSLNDRVRAYIQFNKSKYQEAYPHMIEERFFSPFVRYLAIAFTVCCTPFAAKAADSIWVVIAYLPTPILLLLFPLINSRINRSQFLVFANSLVCIYGCGALLAFSIFVANGRVSAMTAGAPVIFILFFNVITFSSSRLRSIIWGTLVTVVFIRSAYFLDPLLVANDLRGMLIGWALGVLIHFMIDMHIRHNFYSENGRRDALALSDAVPFGIMNIIFDDSDHLFLDSNVSDYTKKIFGDFPDSRISFETYVLLKLKLSDQKKNELIGILKTVIGCDINSFEWNEDNLPKEVVCLRNGEERILELIWKPVLNVEDGNIVKILLLALDISDKRDLVSQVAVLEDKTLKFNELANAGRDVSLSFVRSSRILIDLLRTEVSKTDQSLDKISLHLHTFKGNSRSAGFGRIVSQIHDIESGLEKAILRKVKVDCEEILFDIGSTLDSYVALMEDKLKWKDNDERLELSRADLLKLIPPNSPITLELARSKGLSKSMKNALDYIYPSISRVVSDATHDVEKTASNLKKEKPVVCFVGDDPRLTEEAVNVLRSVIPHLSGNSLDHGIEDTNTRIERGKALYGHIDIKVAVREGAVTLSWSDDGQGLDLDAICEAASKRFGSHECDGLSLDAKAELVFGFRLSTKNDLSEVSGRGVGMSSVRRLMQSIGGSARVELGNQASNGKYEFSIILSFPVKHALEPISVGGKLSLFKSIA